MKLVFIYIRYWHCTITTVQFTLLLWLPCVCACACMCTAACLSGSFPLTCVHASERVLANAFASILLPQIYLVFIHAKIWLPHTGK